VIPPGDYEEFQDEMKARLEALPDGRGGTLESAVFKPKEIYKEVNGIAPDLIVHFGGLYWRSIGSVGRPLLHVEENDTGPDACNHAQFGAFILSAPGTTRSGELAGARLLDIAPTLLQSAGSETPARMQGRSLCT
jgi:predicted AlkP superfamily phosphohydrolase/phosphomutase